MEFNLGSIKSQINAVIQEIQKKINSLTDQEKIAYGSIALGILLIIISLIIW